ncbi:tigger transposable element-derived protein 4 [Hydra vulgaris]|uniref:tigger transposable element-derived protein 4 n=1 Tax=Hydra vulgaris TaxID=6087 RepID=UPI001F5EBD36|nr:tigger transposable element-derived protein 4-like [Hydra vulgaris]
MAVSATILKTKARELAEKININGFRMQPNKSLNLQSGTCIGMHSKIRLTGMVAASPTGDKIPMFVIGKSKSTRCFKGIKHLPCRYRNQNKSWMDSVLFEKWKRKMDTKNFRRTAEICYSDEDNDPFKEVQNQIEKLDNFYPPGTTAEDVIFADENLISAETLLTDEQLIEEVKNAANEHDANDEEDNDDDNATDPVCPKVSDIREGLQVLYDYIPFSLMGEDLQQKLNAVSIIFDRDVSSKLKQSDIITFFNL